jgi:hypothetical protein
VIHRDERAAGALSTVFGIGVFLVLLTTAAHLLLDLWISTSIDAVAHDAATDVATSGAADGELAAVEAQALTRASDALGDWSAGVDLAFEAQPGSDDVVLHVRAADVRYLPGGLADLFGLHGLDRRIVVRREHVDQARP